MIVLFDWREDQEGRIPRKISPLDPKTLTTSFQNIPKDSCDRGSDWALVSVCPYRADTADAGPVWLLIHSGGLVDFTEEEIDLLLILEGRRDDGGSSKLRV